MDAPGISLDDQLIARNQDAIIEQWKEIVHYLMDDISWRVWPPGRIVASQNQPHCPVMYVESGALLLTRLGGAGEHPVALVRGPGWPVGTIEAILQLPSRANVTALVETSVGMLDLRTFHRRVTSDSRLQTCLAKLHGLEAYFLLNGRGWIMGPTVRDRVYDCLRHMWAHASTVGGDPHSFEMPISWKTLARLVGASPETVSRAVARLEQDGMLLRRGRFMTFAADAPRVASASFAD